MSKSKPPPGSTLKYGYWWAPKYDHPAKIDLVLYERDDLRERAGSKALSKEDHLRNAIKESYADHVFSFNKWSNALIDEWCNNNMITVWGASSSGKSGGIAMILLMDLLADPTTTKVSLCTSPLKMHGERCYGSLLKWHTMLPDTLRIGHTRKAPTPALIMDDSAGQVAGVVCISTDQGESEEDLKKKIGAHQKRNRFAVDEPQKCSESILSVFSNFGASGHYIEIFFGNPDSWFSPLGKHSLPLHYKPKEIEEQEPDRWVTKRTYRGKNGICIVMDGRDSPANDDPSLTYLAGPEHIADLKANFGEDSMQLWTYGIGRMPPSGVADVLISQQDLEGAGCMEKPQGFQGGFTELVGLDPSSGRDGCVLLRARVGDRDGTTQIHVMSKHRIEIEIRKGDVSGQIAAEVARKLREWNVPLVNFASDAGGNQGAQVDRIEAELGQRGAHRVNTAGAAGKNRINHMQLANEVYSDRASEVLMNMASLMKQGRIRGVDDQIAHQVTTRKTENRNGRLKVEEKKEWRGRNGDRSPDDMDSLAIVVELAIKKKLIKPYLPPIAAKGGVTAEVLFGMKPDANPQSSRRQRMRRASMIAAKR